MLGLASYQLLYDDEDSEPEFEFKDTVRVVTSSDTSTNVTQFSDSKDALPDSIWENYHIHADTVYWEGKGYIVYSVGNRKDSR